jgi:hypothetical protein
MLPAANLFLMATCYNAAMPPCRLFGGNDTGVTMKKVNLLNEIITVDRSALMQAINRGQTFGITLEGEIVTPPTQPPRPFIYHGTLQRAKSAVAISQKPISIPELFGSDYQVVEDDDRILIKAGNAWQRIIGWNLEQCEYDDTTADGVSHFADETLEQIGWHATEFEIDYRDLLDVIEPECDGILLCIERTEPYQFSGMGFIGDLPGARERAFAYCHKRIAKLIAEEVHYAPDTLSDDEVEAARYFKLL